MCAHLKSDLIKYYLIYCLKNKSKDKILEFFQHYSYEILSESSPLTSGNLRHWYTLPYVEEPEKDPEFSVYFSTRWMELLRITLHNFLTIVFASSSPPKLLLLEKWFRTEKQLELRSQLKLLNEKVDLIMNRFEKYEDRLQNLREVIRILVNYIQNNLHMQQYSSTKGGVGGAGTLGSNTLFDNDREEEVTPVSTINSGKSVNKRGSVGGSTQAQAVDSGKVKEVEQSVSRISAECARKTAILGNLPKEQRMKEILGEIYHLHAGNILSPGHEMNEYLHNNNYSNNTSSGPITSGALSLSSSNSFMSYVSSRKELEDMENDLVTKIQDWIALLKNEHT